VTSGTAPAALDDEVAFYARFRARSVNSVADTARFMQCSTDNVYEAIQRGDIEVFPMGRRKLVLTRPLLIRLGELATAPEITAEGTDAPLRI
jgi:hypothetical protein